jgi:gamma-polyglutamate biosynthesis protein CapA
VTIALVGDVMLGRGVNPTPDSLAYLMPELNGADLALANLESPLGRAGDQLVALDGYDLCAPGGRAGLLAGWGFDLLSIANNHNLDCGPQGVAETISALRDAGIAAIGPGMEAVLREVNGIPLAFLAFDDISGALDEAAAVQAIRSRRQTGALVIVSVHWGMEYQQGASDRQKLLAGQFIRAGAALVWGHHSHVLQPVEWIGASTLVLYSLGNALFDQGGLPDTRQSALVLVEVNAKGIKSVRAVPFVIDVADSRVAAPDTGTAAKILEGLKIK